MYCCFSKVFSLICSVVLKKKILCRTKLFVRWMQGTCIETLPQKVEGEDEPYVFCFFTDISANPEIIDYVQTIQTDIKNTLTNMTRYLNRWKKYRSIWKVDKVLHCPLFFSQQ